MPYRQPCTANGTGRRYTSGLQVASGDNAAFRAWGSELYYNLILAGLTQTVDTGQIDWATAVFPGVNTTAAGYNIFRFNDTVQQNAPIFFKLEYGRGSSATTPAMWVTVGTSSDGAGNIPAPFFPRQRIDPNVGVGTPDFPGTTFIMVKDGFFGFAWACNGSVSYGTTITNSMRAGLFLCRSTDETGNANALGVTMLTHSAGGGNALQQIARRFPTTAATYGPSDICSVPLSQGFADAPTSVNIYPGVFTGLGGSGRSFQDEAGDYSTRMRVYPIWTMYPRIQSLSQVCAVIPADFNVGAEFYAAAKGTRKRRFVVVGAKASGAVSQGYTNTMLAMVWE